MEGGPVLHWLRPFLLTLPQGLPRASAATRPPLLIVHGANPGARRRRRGGLPHAAVAVDIDNCAGAIGDQGLGCRAAGQLDRRHYPHAIVPGRRIEPVPARRRRASRGRHRAAVGKQSNLDIRIRRPAIGAFLLRAAACRRQSDCTLNTGPPSGCGSRAGGDHDKAQREECARSASSSRRRNGLARNAGCERTVELGSDMTMVRARHNCHGSLTVARSIALSGITRVRCQGRKPRASRGSFAVPRQRASTARQWNRMPFPRARA